MSPRKLVLLCAALVLIGMPALAARRRVTTQPGNPCISGVIADLYFSQDIVADDAYVYFADDGGGIFRAPKGGGSVTQLVNIADGSSVQRMVLDGDTLFFGNVDSNFVFSSIFSVPKSGGTPTLRASNILTIYDLVVDDSSIYWIAVGTFDLTDQTYLADGRIEKASKSGANRTSLATNLSEPTGLALDATTVYFTETGSGLGSTAAGIRSVPKNGGTVTKLTNATTTIALLVSGNDLYFSTFNLSSKNGSVQKMPKTGGATTTIEAATAGLLTLALRLSPDRLYAHGVSATSEGIRSFPLAGGAATPVLVSVLDTPYFAVDSCSVYFVTANDTIERVPR
ncbi:MAG TPA: hypothetical protein VEZ11_09480 [Thermoanaerobaculia bacterium]|nr:hypothetical protein [Thermoanaerobaculia bacterium]